jgi:lambda family phage portal protein
MAKLQSNLLDRAIGTVAPGWALKRMQARGMMALAGGYFGGGKGRRTALAGWNPGASDADGDISPDLVDLRSYSRDLARTSPLAGGAINTVVTNVVGTGLAMQATPDADFLKLDETAESAWIDAVDREWKLWAESVECDITRTQNFYALQSLVFRSVLESGDCFVIPTMEGKGAAYRLALQVVEADRVCNPGFSADTDRLVQGVELDGFGAPVAYHVCNKHPGARQRAGATWTRIPAFGADGRRNVLHIFERRRPGQTRGVPYLAGVIEPLKQLKRYSDAEISAAVISAAFAVFVKMDPEAFQSLFDEDASKTYLNAALKWDGGVPAASMDAPGKAVNLLPGESIEAPALGRPNAQFDPFFLAVSKQIGAMLELPVEVLLKQFNSSYSASRAALLDAWRFFRGRRDFVATTLCTPVHGLWFEEAVALGRVRAPGFFADPAWRRAWGAAVWTGDGPGSIDPVKEAGAAEKRIDLELSTRADEALQYDGVPWKVKHRQRAREEAARRKDGTGDQPKVGAGETAPPVYPSDEQQ